MRTADHSANCHLFSFGDHVRDDGTKVRKCGAERGPGLLDASGTRRQTDSGRIVVDVGRREQLIHGVPIALVESIDSMTDEGFVLLNGHPRTSCRESPTNWTNVCSMI